MSHETFPCLSVRQPWADLIVGGVKEVENRSWPTAFRGAILIHAPQKVERQVVDRLRVELGLGPGEEYRPVTGAVVGMTRIVDCVEDHRSRFFVGPYGFLLERSQRFDRPIPCPGRLGIFRLSLELLRESPAASVEPGRFP